MEIRFQEEVKQLDAPRSAENAVKAINLFLQDTHYFSHLIVDGVEVHEDPEAYLVQHLDEIKEIEVVAIPVKEFVNELLLSSEDYLTRAIPYIEHLAVSFKEEPQAEQWADLNDLFEGIQWVASMVMTVSDSIARPMKWDQVNEQTAILEGSLITFEKALEKEDRKQISSLLMKDVKQSFEEINDAIAEIIDQEGKRVALN